MGFRNPIHTLTADQITGGNFSAVYNILGRFVVGDPAHAHVVIGSDSGGADGVRIYAADGVTPLIDLNIGGASTVAASTVVGTVAAATNATNATNLAGGGTASGTTTIAGEIVVGNPAAAHVVVGTDANGADGVRLYAPDGVTPLIDLTISGTPTITGAVVQTATSGSRVVMDESGPGGSGQLSIFDATRARMTLNQGSLTFTDATGVSTTSLTMVRTTTPGQIAAVGYLQAGSLILAGGAFGVHDGAGNWLGVINATGGTGKMQWDGAVLTTAGEIHSQGANGGVSFDDRNAASGKWEWYSHDNLAALWNVATGDAIQVATDGTVTVSAGSLQVGTSSQQRIGMFNNSGIGREAVMDAAVGFPIAVGQWSSDAVAADIVIRTNGHNILFNQNGGAGVASARINPQGGLSVGRLDAGNLGVVGAARVFMSVGAPPNSAGANGDFCLRYDTPGTANQRLYVRSAGVWVGIL